MVPVLPNQELQVLIEAAIKLCKKSKLFWSSSSSFCFMQLISFSELEVNNEACQRFFKDSLLLSFTRVMTDEAVKEWKQEILVSDGRF